MPALCDDCLLAPRLCLEAAGMKGFAAASAGMNGFAVGAGLGLLDAVLPFVPDPEPSRDLEDIALSLSAYCKAGSEIINALQEVPGTDFQGIWSLKQFDAHLRGHTENLSVLTKRISNTIELVSTEHWKSWSLG